MIYEDLTYKIIGAAKEVYKELIDKFHPIGFNNILFNFDHETAFEYLKTLANNPKTAVSLMEQFAKRQEYLSNNFYSKEKISLYEQAKKGDKSFVEKAKKEFFEYIIKGDFSPYMYITLRSKSSSYLSAIVNDNPYAALRFFNKCYKELRKQARNGIYNDKYIPEIEIIIKALKTGDFSKRSITSKKRVPKKEIHKIPNYVDITDPIELAEHLIITSKNYRVSYRKRESNC